MSNVSIRYPGLYRACRQKYAQLIGPIRAVAKEHGYAIGMHGSLARDIDLIAVPWIEKPWSEFELVNAIIAVCLDIVGCGLLNPDDKNPKKMPHGRACWMIHIGDGVYIDLAIMPQAGPVGDAT